MRFICLDRTQKRNERAGAYGTYPLPPCVLLFLVSTPSSSSSYAGLTDVELAQSSTVRIALCKAQTFTEPR